MAKEILLLDCDAMFCAVAKIIDPKGAGQAKELIVGGCGQGNRVVVCSASYGARDKGVKAGMPMGMARRLCPEALCVPVPRAACNEKNREIEQILLTWSPLVESASIDEFYLDLSGMHNIYPGKSLGELGQLIRQEVESKTGLGVSIGGGRNKMIAKMAVEEAKPRKGGQGVFIVEDNNTADWLENKELKDVPGVGPKAQERYKMFGWRTIRDVRLSPREHVLIWLGEREGEWLCRAIWGTDDSEVKAQEEAKSISHETTFPKDVSSTPLLKNYLKFLAGETAAQTRADGLIARTVTVRVRDSDFTTRQASKTLGKGINSDLAVYKTARELLDKLRSAKQGPLRLIGVGLSKFQAGQSGEELNLEELKQEDPEFQDVSLLLDKIRSKHGHKIIGYGAAKAVEKNENAG